jgi:hypothetical protein
MRLSHCFAVAGISAFVYLGAQAQVYKIHNADVAVGGTGQFTTSITDQTNTPHQSTTDSAGFLLSFRDHPVSWAGIELNYQYSSFTEKFVALNGRPLENVALSMHEATAAYLLHSHRRHLQPFVGVGGGALYFNPSPEHVVTQLRGVGLTTIGADMVSPASRLGFRVQARGLFYRAPNFNNPGIATSRWVATSEPSASVFVRF